MPMTTTRHNQADCELCIHSAKHGWWGVAYTHCRHCGRSWSAKGECHCAVCHRHFSSVTTFDQHRRHGECLSDRTLIRIKLRRVESRWGIVWKGEERVGTGPAADI